VYRGGGSSGSRQLTWFDRSGRSSGSLGAPGSYTTLSVSPDGKRVAFGLADTAQNNTDIWVHDLTQGTIIRFTSNPAVDDMPVWSPDGTRIVWSSRREGGVDLYHRDSNLADDETALLRSPQPKFPQDWSSDGRFLIYSVNRGDRDGTNLDLWLLPLKGEKKATQFLGTPFTESQGRFSPDSRYIAYVSNESGKAEVYVRSFGLDGKAGGQQMISQGGGSQPLWRSDGKEIFYISGDTKVMAVPVSTSPAFQRVGAPTALFTAPIYGAGRNPNAHRWAVMPNGQKFIIISVLTEAASEPITVIRNWTELLKK
jgi:Tol biopolymer transport system component